MAGIHPAMLRGFMHQRRTSGRVIFGFIIFVFGAYYVLVLAGKARPIIPQDIMSWILGVGCIVGGFYMMFAKLFRHPLYG
ncbi:hypothetical protein HYV81_01075 [Candidatus Woesearchaeota archaeon]|nr:hypothetical protein [Candidatus Woesearchaeota archaeon]